MIKCEGVSLESTVVVEWLTAKAETQPIPETANQASASNAKAVKINMPQKVWSNECFLCLVH